MGVELSISACIIIVVALPYLAPLPLDPYESVFARNKPTSARTV